MTRPKSRRLRLTRLMMSGQGRKVPHTFQNPGGQPTPIQLRPRNIRGETVNIYTRGIPRAIDDEFNTYIAEKNYRKREALLSLIRWVYHNEIDLGMFLCAYEEGELPARVNLREVPYIVSDKFRIYCIHAGATQRDVISAIMKWASFYKFDLTILP